MKILYAIQGTGNGHISRAIQLGPELEKVAEVDYFISGCQNDISLPIKSKFQKKGASFYFGKNGGIDIYKTLKDASIFRLLKDILSIPIQDYDLIINDYEPITAWACRWIPEKLIAISHQAAFYSHKCPRPNTRNHLLEFLMHQYAPAKNYIGLHFKKYDENIMTPLIRDDIRILSTSRKDYVTVYLPAYGDDKLINIFLSIPEIQWKIYSKHSDRAYQKKNVCIYPVGHPSWLQSFAESEGLVLGAGFESPSEALCLGKKIITIPMRGQYEQQCNAVALQQLGVKTLPNLSNNKIVEIKNWLVNGNEIKKSYPRITSLLKERIVTYIDNHSFAIS